MSPMVAGERPGAPWIHYVHYIDDHITRLHAIDCQRLADSFHRWRARLLLS